MTNLNFKNDDERNEFFTDLNSILKKYSIENLEITSIKMKVDPLALDVVCIYPKQKFCYMDNNGKTYCRCI